MPNLNNTYELPDLQLVEHTLSNRVAKVTNLDHHLSVPASWLVVLLMRGVPQDAPEIDTDNPVDVAQAVDDPADIDATAGAAESSGGGSSIVTPTAARKRSRRK